jgi:hypothetical protein
VFSYYDFNYGLPLSRSIGSRHFPPEEQKPIYRPVALKGLKKLCIRFQVFAVVTAVLDQTMSFWVSVRCSEILIYLNCLFLTVAHVYKQNLFMGGSVDQDPGRNGYYVDFCLQHYSPSHIQFPAGEIVLY